MKSPVIQSSLVAAGAIALAIVGAIPRPAAAHPPKTRLVSINAAGNDGGDQASTFSLITPDGRFVVFLSKASDLAANDTNGKADIFERDLKTRTTRLVSVNAAGTDAGDGQSGAPAVSADGRFVLFESAADDLAAGDTNSDIDVFVRDLKKGVTRLVSVNAAGNASGDRRSDPLAITPDGRFVLFQSMADDLVAGDSNGKNDVFVRDLKKGVTTLASVNAAGTGSANGLSFGGVITPDGRYVAFISQASDLVAGDTNGEQDVFVRDLKTGVTRLVSLNRNLTAPGNGFSTAPAITPDGRFIAFESVATDLVAGHTTGLADIFVRDLRKGVTTLVSVNSGGVDGGDALSVLPVITPDGRFVLFASKADDLVANDTNSTLDLYLRDLKRGTTKLVSVNAAGTDGGAGDSLLGFITANGRFVIFESSADDLVAGDSNGIDDVFVRDLKHGTTALVSVNALGTGSGDGFAALPSITPDGRIVSFASIADDLIPGDLNQAEDVFVRNLK